MTRFDLSPLFRSTIGFDHLDRLLDSALSGDDNGYPPYNIEKTGEDAYRITVALAGFAPEDLSVTQHGDMLVVSGKVKEQNEERRYLHRGIAGRAFERRFRLADFIKVTGAEMVNGLLHVDLVREVPEAMRPRAIKIEKGAPKATIEAKAA